MSGMRPLAAIIGALAAVACGDETIELTSSSTGATTSTASSSASTGTGLCVSTGDDRDGDGFTIAMGDCNDCDPSSNPGAIEVSASGADEDCDGETDEDELSCDENLTLGSDDPIDAARALDLCRLAQGGPGWGIVSATWAQMDGSEPPVEPMQKLRFDLGHGNVTRFGKRLRPVRGERMLVLSTGEARDLDDPDATKGYGESNPVVSKWYSCSPPDGFPREIASCTTEEGTVTTGAQLSDSIALDLEVQTPSNAHGFSFDHYYMDGSFPLSCANVNPFLALLDPMPAGQFNGNIVFDKTGEYLGMSSTIRACGCIGGPPCTVYSLVAPPSEVTCPLGDADLLGTGFGRDGGDPGGGTGWQRTQAPVAPASPIKLRITVGEADASGTDATVLIDNWTWLLTAGVPVETVPR